MAYTLADFTRNGGLMSKAEAREKFLEGIRPSEIDSLGVYRYYTKENERLWQERQQVRKEEEKPKHYCVCCFGWSVDDSRGHCSGCGYPRADNESEEEPDMMRGSVPTTMEYDQIEPMGRKAWAYMMKRLDDEQMERINVSYKEFVAEGKENAQKLKAQKLKLFGGARLGGRSRARDAILAAKRIKTWDIEETT